MENTEERCDRCDATPARNVGEGMKLCHDCRVARKELIKAFVAGNLVVKADSPKGGKIVAAAPMTPGNRLILTPTAVKATSSWKQNTGTVVTGRTLAPTAKPSVQVIPNTQKAVVENVMRSGPVEQEGERKPVSPKMAALIERGRKKAKPKPIVEKKPDFILAAAPTVVRGTPPILVSKPAINASAIVLPGTPTKLSPATSTPKKD